LPLSCTQLLLSLQFLAAGRRRLGGSAFDSIITISHDQAVLLLGSVELVMVGAGEQRAAAVT
jgi:hypothetical protein